VPSREPAVAGGAFAKDVLLDDQPVKFLTFGLLGRGSQKRREVSEHHRPSRVRPAHSSFETKLSPHLAQGAWAPGHPCARLDCYFHSGASLTIIHHNKIQRRSQFKTRRPIGVIGVNRHVCFILSLLKGFEYFLVEMRPFNRQERYRRLEENHHAILGRIREQQSHGICNMSPIVNLAYAWINDIKSFLGQERFRRAIGAGLPPAFAYATHGEIAQYLQIVGNELQHMKKEEDGQTLADLARRGERLAQGQMNVKLWKEEVDEWIDELEDRLRNEQGDEDATAEWLSLKTPQVFSNPPSDHHDREQLFQAITERLCWLRNRIRLGAVAAVPTAPQFHYDQRALWVLESEHASNQGTAFALAGSGLITCQHVIHADTKAFRPDDWESKWPVTVVCASSDLDLAILKIDAPLSPDFVAGSGHGVKQLDQIAVLGFPNYRLGDTGVLSPGFIVGHRMVSGIRRILVNAPIVAGNSGGPVLDRNSRVIGVAVTGADRMEDAQTTEDHGAIPIEALERLRR
jgi:S1-C subfamily serine protease